MKALAVLDVKLDFQCSFYCFIVAILSNYLYLISQINIYKSQNIENESTYRQTRCAAKVKAPCSIARVVLSSREVLNENRQGLELSHAIAPGMSRKTAIPGFVL